MASYDRVWLALREERCCNVLLDSSVYIIISGD
jgi:hypothetical protein